MSGCADPGGSVGAFLCQAGQMLRAAAVESPRQEARLLLSHAMGRRPEDLLRDPRAPVPPEAAESFDAMLRRRLAREPMALILGHAGFWTLDLLVSRATLIPRPDTESLIEAALGAFPDRGAVRRVLDLGTGSGALLLAALTEFPAALGVGVDVIPEAAALARRNAERNGLGNRALLLAGRWGAALSARFELVLCNPPYIESAAIPGLMPEVARHEPVSALDGGVDGLDAYREVLDGLPALLTPGGVAVLELGQGQRPAVSALAQARGFRVHACREDLGGVARALVVGWTLPGAE